MQPKKVKECPKQYSCTYTKHRFGITECCCKILRQTYINELHKDELKAREQMLREVKNYGR